MKTEKEILEAIGYAETLRDYSTGILREQLNERIRVLKWVLE